MKKHHLHLVSDSTGGTLNSVVKACLSQFDGVETELHFWPLIRSQHQLQGVAEALVRHPGLVLYTLWTRRCPGRWKNIVRRSARLRFPFFTPSCI